MEEALLFDRGKFKSVACILTKSHITDWLPDHQSNTSSLGRHCALPVSPQDKNYSSHSNFHNSPSPSDSLLHPHSGQ